VRELEDLARRHHDGLWQRWALSHVARLRALEGDVASAADALDDLDAAACDASDAGGVHLASYRCVLRTTVTGDWVAARAAVDAVRAAADAAMFDPAASAMAKMGALGIIDLLSGHGPVGELPPIEWPLPTLELSFRAWHADCLASTGLTERAVGALDAIDPATVTDVDRDGYWLPTLTMLASAAHIVGSRPIAAAVAECAEPALGLTVFDPGSIYRGTVNHAAGLAAATLGQHDVARELLSLAGSEHRRHGSPWMTARSDRAIAALD
jgi:hypothetical protein